MGPLQPVPWLSILIYFAGSGSCQPMENVADEYSGENKFGQAYRAFQSVVKFAPNEAKKMYDTYPKLRLAGAGFEAIAEDLEALELEFGPNAVEKDDVYSVEVKDDDTMFLVLRENKRWTEPVDGPPNERPLYLEKATYKGQALLDARKQVTTLVPTPTVEASTNIVYLTASSRLRITGTNFQEKGTHLYFDPPLLIGQQVDVMVQSSTAIIVSLVQKRDVEQKWASEPGPLKLTAIDTGAGKLFVRKDLGGVTIAELQADMKGGSIKIQATEVALYQSMPTLTVPGEGFRVDADGSTRFGFGNSLKLGTNYTVAVSDYAAVFTLNEGSKWQQNVLALPGPLILLAADAGGGWVPLGANMGKAGRKVATVYEDPSLKPSRQVISRTVTHELEITGRGFAKDFPPLLVFDPPMDRSTYVVHVSNRTHMKVSLASEGQGWMADGQSGDLSVRVINTGAGMVQFLEPIVVATVEEDAEPHHSGIVVRPSYETLLYQSTTSPLFIEGENFPMDGGPDADGNGITLTFGFDGPKPESITCKVVSETQLEVKLKDGYTWAMQGGPLMLTNIDFGVKQWSFSSPGVKVAMINDDPFVEANLLQVYSSYTRHITIHGHGFVSWRDPYFKPEIVLSPTLPGDYKIADNDWTNVAITISLSLDPDAPPESQQANWAEVTDDGDTVHVKVVSINTGAGAVAMPGGGIVVAAVRKDDETFSCDDSCIHAADGQCDEDQAGASSEKFGWSGYSTTNGASTSSSPIVPKTSSRRGYAEATDSSMRATDDQLLRTVPSCQMGTDCTDCGLQMVEDGKCDNTCKFSRDGACDDRRNSGVCADGTDCQDCGPWGHGNFTLVDETLLPASLRDGYDDDDNSFLMDPNHPSLLGQSGNHIGRYKRVFVQHRVKRQDSESAAGVFMDTLWAAIVMVGFSVMVAAGVIAVRCLKGQSINLTVPTNPDVQGRR